MSYFERHLFICTNARHNDCKQSCNDNGEGDAAVDFFKGHAKKRDLIGPASCASAAPAAGVAANRALRWRFIPKRVGSTYADEEDLQEILDQDLAKGEAVARLLIDAPDS